MRVEDAETAARKIKSLANIERAKGKLRWQSDVPIIVMTSAGVEHGLTIDRGILYRALDEEAALLRVNLEQLGVAFVEEQC
jgi:hypothetical protein